MKILNIPSEAFKVGSIIVAISFISFLAGYYVSRPQPLAAPFGGFSNTYPSYPLNPQSQAVPGVFSGDGYTNYLLNQLREQSALDSDLQQQLQQDYGTGFSKSGPGGGDGGGGSGCRVVCDGGGGGGGGGAGSCPGGCGYMGPDPNHPSGCKGGVCCPVGLTC